MKIMESLLLSSIIATTMSCNVSIEDKTPKIEQDEMGYVPIGMKKESFFVSFIDNDTGEVFCIHQTVISYKENIDRYKETILNDSEDKPVISSNNCFHHHNGTAEYGCSLGLITNNPELYKLRSVKVFEKSPFFTKGLIEKRCEELGQETLSVYNL